MQVMPATYEELRVKHGLGPDPFDPRDNILAGAAYLAEMFGRYGSSGFLAAYNAGPRRYEDYLSGRPLPLETTDYVARLAPQLGFVSLPVGLSTAPIRAPGSPIFLRSLSANSILGSCHSSPDRRPIETQKSRTPSPLPGAFRRQNFCPGNAFDPHVQRCKSSCLRASRQPFRRAFDARSTVMTAFALWRSLAKSLAPLCASALEGAQATDLRPDKRDSLRLCPAVGLSLRRQHDSHRLRFRRAACQFAQAHVRNHEIFTSSLCAHVR